ncbi:MAG: hypothetical protein OXI60_05130, partial [Acidiferrobacterales bacterium]|nr:hypothetical protein [Acidiferrobacterales bacterium]
KIGVAYIDHVALGMKNMPGMDDDGNIGMDHINDHKTSMIAGQYNIGGMGMYLGYGQSKWDTDSVAAVWGVPENDPNTTVDESDKNVATNFKWLPGLGDGALLEKKKKTTFFGVSGGLADTGVSFFLQVRSNKVDKRTVMKSYREHKAAFDAINPTGSGLVAAVADTRQAAYLKEHGLLTSDQDGEALIVPGGRDDAAYPSNVSSNADKTKYDNTRHSASVSDKVTPWVVGLSRSLGGGASVHFEHENKDDDSKKNKTGLWLKVDF